MHVYESRSVRDDVGAASTFKRHNQTILLLWPFPRMTPFYRMMRGQAARSSPAARERRLSSAAPRGRSREPTVGCPGLGTRSEFAGYDKVKRDVLRFHAHELNRDTRERVGGATRAKAAMKRHPFAPVWWRLVCQCGAAAGEGGQPVRYVPPNPIVSTRRARGARRQAERCG